MIVLGENIKAHRKKMNLNQKELADYLNVSQTSIAHYEKGTRQPTIETLVSLATLFNQSLDDLIGYEKPKVNKTVDQDDIVKELIIHLLNKDENAFFHLFRNQVMPSHTIKEAIERVLQKIMYQIGTMWEQGIVSEADEHYATFVVRKALLEITNISKVKNQAKKSISFSIGNEQHTLGIEMIHSYLVHHGINDIYIGNNLPIKSIEQMIFEEQPKYVFISVTLKEHLNILELVLNQFEKLYKNDLKIAVGGQAVSSQSLQKRENVILINDIASLIDFLDEEELYEK
jgi:methanogenic corrinoid protein MtbC1/predicted XRE-type DNA-binding protein